MYRIDRAAAGRMSVENPLALLEVTLVQLTNDLCQAVVATALDTAFWAQAEATLAGAHKICPPRNLIVPCTVPGLESLPHESIAVFRRYLESYQQGLLKDFPATQRGPEETP